MKPKVSVIIVTYYRNEELEKCVKSVANQDYDNTEIVVVDSSGEDYAKNVIETLRSAGINVNYISQERDQGLTFARQVGLEESTGEYIHFLDDDDTLLAGAISKKVDKINDDVGVVYSGVKWDNGQKVLPNNNVRGDVLAYALSLQMAPCLPSTMLIDKSVIEDMPLQYELAHDDAARKIELARRTKFDFVNEALVNRGSPDDSRGSSIEDLQERRATITEYSDLYEQFPPKIKQVALSRTYIQEGQIIIHEEYWSTKAIMAMAKACIYAPGFPLMYVAALVASFGGRPGWQLGFSVYSKFIGNSRTGNIGQIGLE